MIKENNVKFAARISLGILLFYKNLPRISNTNIKHISVLHTFVFM